MEFALLGWPEDGPTLRLDYREFAYAGKFVMSNTGKVVAREDDETLGAASFNADRTDPGTAWIRYVTVREDRRGEGIGPRLCAFAVKRLEERFDAVKIAVNNPFAYEALYKASFAFTGETTGVAELVLRTDAPRTQERYQSGLERYRERDLSEAEAEFLDSRVGSGPPAPTREPEP